jgi:hypothetical protein
MMKTRQNGYGDNSSVSLDRPMLRSILLQRHVRAMSKSPDGASRVRGVVTAHDPLSKVKTTSLASSGSLPGKDLQPTHGPSCRC